jgi:hypothetical protein
MDYLIYRKLDTLASATASTPYTDVWYWEFGSEYFFVQRYPYQDASLFEANPDVIVTNIIPGGVEVLRGDSLTQDELTAIVFKIVQNTSGSNTDQTIISSDQLDPNTAGTVFTPAQPMGTDVIYRTPDGGLWTYNGTIYIQSASKVPPIRVAPNDGGAGTIPAGTETFVMSDGNFSTPLVLPVITKDTKQICIINRAASNGLMDTTHQVAGAVAQVVTKNVPLWFIPSADGWYLDVDNSIVSYNNTVPYASSATNRTIRFTGQISGLALHDPLTCPGMVMVVENASLNNQPFIGQQLTVLSGSGAISFISPARSYTIQALGSAWVVIDQGGQPSITNITASATNYTVTPTDEVVAFGGAFAGNQPISFPAATVYPGQEIAFRLPVAYGCTLQITSGAGTIEIPETSQATVAYIQGATTSYVAWKSDGFNWRLTSWVDRKYYSTSGYPTPNYGVGTFNGIGNPATPPSYQIPAGYLGFATYDGDFVGPIILPVGPTSTGTFSVWINNSGLGFPTIIRKENTRGIREVW